MTLSEIIEALETATEPSREIDEAIARFRLWSPHGGKLPAEGAPAHWFSDAFGMPLYTKSLDYAMELCVSALPGWRICFEAVDGIAADLYILGPLYRDDYPERESSPPIAGKPIAMALVLATLKALQARGDA